MIPVTCSWGRTRSAGAEGRCRSLWKESEVGSPHLAVRSGWAAGCCLVVLECCGPGALRHWGPCSRHSARGWAGGCRSKPVSVTNRPTVQTPRSTEGWRRRATALGSVSIRQLARRSTDVDQTGDSCGGRKQPRVSWMRDKHFYVKKKMTSGRTCSKRGSRNLSSSSSPGRTFSKHSSTQVRNSCLSSIPSWRQKTKHRTALNSHNCFVFFFIDNFQIWMEISKKKKKKLTWNINMASFSLYSHCFMAVSTSDGMAGRGELQPWFGNWR